jgi:hypothetical protein
MAKKDKATAEVEGVDPESIEDDPDTAAEEDEEAEFGVEGAEEETPTTSSAAARVEGVTAGETPPDPGEAPHSTDGPEYPFPTAGDVDVDTVPEAEVGAEEFTTPLTVEDWVVLGDHEAVPERFVGRRAVVLDAPTESVPVGEEGDQEITVRTRDEANATLTIPFAAVAEVQRHGVDHTVRG